MMNVAASLLPCEGTLMVSSLVLGLNELCSLMTSSPSVRTVVQLVGGKGSSVKSSQRIDETFFLTKSMQDAKLPLSVPRQVFLLSAIASLSSLSLQFSGVLVQLTSSKHVSARGMKESNSVLLQETLAVVGQAARKLYAFLAAAVPLVPFAVSLPRRMEYFMKTLSWLSFSDNTL